MVTTGIASILLPRGRTTHSRFDIPIHLCENSTCGIRQNTMLPELVIQTSLIIWDEAPMQHKHAFEALDRGINEAFWRENCPIGGRF